MRASTGTGMPKDILERVFEPFFSEPGEGTIVKIYLPRLLGEIENDQTPEREGVADVAQTILLVEDDHDVRAYMVEILRELHYRVLEAHDADSALGIVDRNDVQVDLLLTDVVLPGMNGRQLAEALKVRQPEIRVLFMSGYSRDAIVHQGRLDPGVELMQKPLTQEIVEEKIRAILDSARWPRQQLKEKLGLDHFEGRS